MRGLAGSLFILIGVSTIVALFSCLRRPALVCFIVAFGAVLVWWPQLNQRTMPIGRQMSPGKSLERLTATC
jgi:hypothetical protein